VGIRLVVAGSPGWHRSQVDIVTYALALHLAEWTESQASDFVLLAGTVTTGAERVARDFWVQAGGRVWKYPLDWKVPCDSNFCDHGPRRPNGHGGHCPWVIVRRNKKMLDRDPDRCLSFITADAEGAWLLTEMAVTAKVHTTIHTATEVWDIPPASCPDFDKLRRHITRSTLDPGPATTWAGRWP